MGVLPGPVCHPLILPPPPAQPENIMLQDKDVPEPQIKIIDFGLAQKLEDGVAFKSLCGTPQYIGTEPPPGRLWVGGGAVGPQKSCLCGSRAGVGSSRDRAPTLGVPAPLMCAPPPALPSPPAPEVINYEPLSSATDMW